MPRGDAHATQHIDAASQEGIRIKPYGGPYHVRASDTTPRDAKPPRWSRRGRSPPARRPCPDRFVHRRKVEPFIQSVAGSGSISSARGVRFAVIHAPARPPYSCLATAWLAARPMTRSSPCPRVFDRFSGRRNESSSLRPRSVSTAPPPCHHHESAQPVTE